MKHVGLNGIHTQCLVQPSNTDEYTVRLMTWIFFIQENAFENVVCEMAAILRRPQLVRFSTHQVHILHVVFYTYIYIHIYI